MSRKKMGNQMVTKWSKAVLAVAGAIGIQINPGHIEAMASGVAAAYAVITAVEAWLRKRRG